MKAFIFSLFFGLLALISTGATAESCKVTPLRKPYQSGYYVVDFPRSQVHAKVRSGHFPFLSRFQKKIQAHTPVSPLFLLRRQRKFFESFEGGVRIFNQAIEGQLGRLRSMSCMEAFLLDAHFSQMKTRSEFMAYILTRPHSAKKRLVVSSQNEMSVTIDNQAWRLLNRFLKEGWTLEGHLHNHPFSLNNPYGDIAGTPLPSETDFETYRNLKRNKGLKKAIVTNGFDSLELHASEF